MNRNVVSFAAGAVALALSASLLAVGRADAGTPATEFTVDSTGDESDANPGDGECATDPVPLLAECTYRAAIEEANETPNDPAGPDRITFDIPGGCPQTIAPLTALPLITDPVIIDGYTQPESSPNTLPLGEGNDATLCIELSGADVDPYSVGVFIFAGGTTVRGLVINRFSAGIFVHGGDANTIAGNFIGPDATGAAGPGNADVGVNISTFEDDPSSGNLVGGPPDDPAATNIISGNNVGVLLNGVSDNTIAGNSIGGSSIGGAFLGNDSSGVVTAFGASNNSISSNLIVGSGSDGVQIGDVEEGDSGAGNWVTENTIDESGFLGIDLGEEGAGAAGVTPNDPGDADAGPNNLQNYPVLSSATVSSSGTLIEGTLNTTANAVFEVEFFVTAECDPSGFGEGRFVDAVTVTTDGSGDASFSHTVDGLTDVAGSAITSTASGPFAEGAARSTSEFSACVTARAGGATQSPTPSPVVSPTPATTSPSPVVSPTPSPTPATTSPPPPSPTPSAPGGAGAPNTSVQPPAAGGPALAALAAVVLLGSLGTLATTRLGTRPRRRRG